MTDPASPSDSGPAFKKRLTFSLRLGHPDCQSVTVTPTDSLSGGQQVPRWQSTHWLPECAPAREAASGTKDRATVAVTDMADGTAASESIRGGGSGATLAVSEGGDWEELSLPPCGPPRRSLAERWLLCTDRRDATAAGSQLSINMRSKGRWSSLQLEEHGDVTDTHGLAANLRHNMVSLHDSSPPVGHYALLQGTTARLGKEGGDKFRLVHASHLQATREDIGNVAGTGSDSGIKPVVEQQHTLAQVCATMAANRSHIEAEPQRLGLSQDRNRHYFDARHSELIRAWCCSFDSRSGSQSHSPGEGAGAGICLPTPGQKPSDSGCLGDSPCTCEDCFHSGESERHASGVAGPVQSGKEGAARGACQGQPEAVEMLFNVESATAAAIATTMAGCTAAAAAAAAAATATETAGGEDGPLLAQLKAMVKRQAAASRAMAVTQPSPAKRARKLDPPADNTRLLAVPATASRGQLKTVGVLNTSEDIPLSKQLSDVGITRSHGKSSVYDRHMQSIRAAVEVQCQFTDAPHQDSSLPHLGARKAQRGTININRTVNFSVVSNQGSRGAKWEALEFLTPDLNI